MFGDEPDCLVVMLRPNTNAVLKFRNQFQKDQEVYVNGTRGSLGPFKVDEGKLLNDSTCSVVSD